MKAITVTTENKINFPNKAIDTDVVLSVPKKYYYDKLYLDFNNRTQLHVPAGFLDITSPNYNSETEYLITSQVDRVLEGQNILGYQYKKGSYTPEQIAQNAQNALDSDNAATNIGNRKADGELYYKRKMDYIERVFNEGLLSIEPIKFANRYFDTALSPLTRGNWASAQTALLTTPTIPNAYTAQDKQRLSAFYNEVKADVNNYVAQTYNN